MAKRPTLREQLDAAIARADAATDRADRAEERLRAGTQTIPGLDIPDIPEHARRALDEAAQGPGRFKRWINSLDAWETIGLLIAVIAVAGGIGYFGGADESWLAQKARHYMSVLAHGVFGAFLGSAIMWGLNKWKPLQKRVAQAADDSIWAVEAWRKRRQADTDSPWGVQDSIATVAACIRYGASVLPPILLAAVSMLLAT